MKARFVISIILSVFTVFYIFLIPNIVPQNLDINIYARREKNAEPTYKGIVTLWNVGAPSVAVNRLISYTEKKYTRFFIEKENVSQEEAQSRIADGEYPDIIIFSSGLFSGNPQLHPLEESIDISDRITATATQNGALYALPFMADVYFPDAESGETIAPVTLFYIAVPAQSGDFKEEFLCKAIYRSLDEKFQKYLAENSYIPLINGENLYETENMYSVAKDEIISNVNFKNIFAP